jgi:hypothetical protein
VLDASFFQTALVSGASLFLLLACLIGLDLLRRSTASEARIAKQRRDNADGSRAPPEDSDGEGTPLLGRVAAFVDGDGADATADRCPRARGSGTPLRPETMDAVVPCAACASPGCARAAKYGFCEDGDGREAAAVWCRAHREERDGVKAPRAVPRTCTVPGCVAPAVYGTDRRRPLFCRTHRRKGTEVVSRIGRGPRRFFAYDERLPPTLRTDRRSRDPMQFT